MEKLILAIPTYAWNEDLKQVVEDDMLTRNRNFVQLAELVCSMHGSSIITELFPCSNTFFCRLLRLSET